MTAVDTPAPPVAPWRRPRTALWVAAAVGVTLAVFVALLATRRSASDTVAPSPLLGQPAPEIEGPALDGTRVRLSELRGSYVVVNFFATWCVPCRREHPELVRFSQSAGPEARVVSVIYDDQLDEVRRYFTEHGGDWPVVDASGSKVDYGVRGVPESFLVDPGGTVIARLIGGVTAGGLELLLAQAEGGS